MFPIFYIIDKGIKFMQAPKSRNALLIYKFLIIMGIVKLARSPNLVGKAL